MRKKERALQHSCPRHVPCSQRNCNMPIWSPQLGINQIRVTAGLSRRLTDRHVRPSCPSVKEYLSIFKHILENIQRICQFRPIANGHVRPSITSLNDIFTPCPSFTLLEFGGLSNVLKATSTKEVTSNCPDGKI
jgi:hypothetical protein